MTRTILTGIIAAVAAAPLAAQQPAPRVDRIGHIVAIVGDSAILNFDIQDGVLALAAQAGQTVTQGTPEYREMAEQVLELRIEELLMLQAAQRDTTIRVVDDQINNLVQQKVNEDVRQLGGMPQLEQALSDAGLTLQAYRERLVRQFTKQSLIEQYRASASRARRPPPVSESELRALYEEHKNEIGMRPATVTLQRIIVPVRASDDEFAAARVRADSVFALVRAGEDYASLARQFGEDETRSNGGDLGWMRRSEMTRSFADVAYSLSPGAVSGPVRTRYGYHLIKVDRIRGPEVQVRHILFQPEVTPDDVTRARAQADTVAQRLRAGEDPARLLEQYGEADYNLRVGPSEIGVFEQQFGVDLSQAKVGDVLDPLATGPGGSVSEVAVLKVQALEPARPWSIDDAVLREQLRQQAQFAQLRTEILNDLRRSTYVEIRDF